MYTDIISKKSGYNFHIIKNNQINRGVRYKEYRKLWERTSKEHIITPFPLHLDIEVTSYCNLRCVMCPRTHRVQMGLWENAHLSFDIFKDIIDVGVPLGLCAINLNNFGESFMNKDLCRMIRYAKEKGILDIMLHSNGTLLNKEISMEVIESGLDTIIFSVDSITKEIYEKIRVGASYKDTIDNIRFFSDLRRKLNKVTPQIRISMVYMKENAHEKELYEQFWGDDADIITYTNYRNQDNLDKEDRYVFKKEENRSYACPSLWQRMSINATGEVTACCRDAGKRLVLGNLKNSPLLDIWKGEILRNARILHESKNAWKLKACNGCDHIRGYQTLLQ